MSLTDHELQRLRDAHSEILTGSCSIWRKSKSTNAAGGADDTWQEHLSDVACLLMPERSRRMIEVQAEREIMTVYYRLTVPYDTDIQSDDRVDYEGDTYEIVALWDDHTLRTARRAIMAKVL
ncbi:MAG TPA: phage head closure protein [Aggregatilineales bacterium]|nr:phage head closure protein [Aggregatilineales bacterium]